MWYIYLLWNPKINRTYVGCTTNPYRRLRQHNKQIKGGARATSKGAPNWIIYCYIKGFKNRSEAMRWERIVKKSSHGLIGRANDFKYLILGSNPNRKSRYKVPTDLEIYWALGIPETIF